MSVTDSLRTLPPRKVVELLGELAATAAGDLRITPHLLGARPRRLRAEAMAIGEALGLLADDAFLSEEARVEALERLGSASAIADCHAAIARRLEAMIRGTPEPDVLTRIARHWDAAREPKRASEYFLATANHFLKLRDFHAAATHYEEARRRGFHSPALAGRAALDHAEALHELDRGREAIEAVAMAISIFESIDAPAELAKAKITASRFQGLNILREAEILRDLPASEWERLSSDQQLELKIAIGAKAFAAQDVAALREVVRQLHPLLPAQGPVLNMRAENLRMFARELGADGTADDKRERDRFRAAIEDAYGVGETVQAMYAQCNLALFEAKAANLAQARNDALRVRELAIAQRHGFIERLSGLILMLTTLLAGDLSGARKYIRDDDRQASRARFLEFGSLWPITLLAALDCGEGYFSIDDVRSMYSQASRAGASDNRVSCAATLVHRLPPGDPQSVAIADEAITHLVSGTADIIATALLGAHGSPATLRKTRDLIEQTRVTHHADLVDGTRSLFEALVHWRLHSGESAASHAKESRLAFERIGFFGLARLARLVAVRGPYAWNAFWRNERVTRRESAVEQYLRDGKPNHEIAVSLGIAQTTVEKHVSSILRKRGMLSRDELLILRN